MDFLTFIPNSYPTVCEWFTSTALASVGWALGIGIVVALSITGVALAPSGGKKSR